MADKQIFELNAATLNILSSGVRIGFVIQVEGYDEDFEVAPDVLLSYIGQNISSQTTSFKGLLTTINTNPGAAVKGDAWIAVIPGNYYYFGNLALTKNFGVFTYNGSTWILTQQNLSGIGGSGGGVVNVATTKIEKRETDLQHNGESWYLDLSAEGLPDFPVALQIYVSDSASKKGVTIIPQYDADTKILYGFSDPANVQYIKAFYQNPNAQGSSTGGGSVTFPIIGQSVEGDNIRFKIQRTGDTNQPYTEVIEAI